MVAIGFLPPKTGDIVGTYKWYTLSFCECRLIGGDTLEVATTLKPYLFETFTFVYFNYTAKMYNCQRKRKNGQTNHDSLGSLISSPNELKLLLLI